MCCKSMVLAIYIVWGFCTFSWIFCKTLETNLICISWTNLGMFCIWWCKFFETHLVMCDTLKIVGAKTMLSSDGCEYKAVSMQRH